METASLRLRKAGDGDVDLLASLNEQLIRDEGHRNPMVRAALAARMDQWLQGDHEAYLFDRAGDVVGYALYRHDSDAVYLRQFFVGREHRRRGLGRDAFELLCREWKRRKPRVRLEVLVGNAGGIEFWRALGFRDYCITMELGLEE